MSIDAPAIMPTPTRRSASGARSVGAPSRGSAAVDPLAVETELLEGARRCLEASDVECATSKLAAHRAAFPRGALADEASILRVEVALARGDRATAEQLAEEMIRNSPSGPYARRARAVLED